MNSSVILDCEAVSHRYHSGDSSILVLNNISFSLNTGDFLAITGPSGSGKTTLLGLLAGLDRIQNGRIYLAGQDLTLLSEDQRARLRRQRVGFIFQSFQLIPTLTARENIQLPLELAGQPADHRASELLERVGLAQRADHYPVQLSGGEQQRVAIARAFSTRPALLFADEPTGNLDQANGHRVMDLMLALNETDRSTLVLVTHDSDLAARAQRIIQLQDGTIVRDSAA